MKHSPSTEVVICLGTLLSGLLVDSFPLDLSNKCF